MNNYQYNGYNNYNNGYNNYGNDNNFNPFAEKLQEKRRLATISRYCGGAVVAFAVIGIVAGLLMLANNTISNLYDSNAIFETAFYSLLSVISIGSPFLIAYQALKKKKYVDDLPLGTPYNKADFALLIPVCLLICIIGSIATGFLSAIVNTVFGITFETPEDTGTYTTITGILLSVFQTALIPAFVEEFAIRGVVLQSLRRYGDKFAILMSSAVFALMHGNMVQIPFAFIAGIALGYVVIKTGTMWTGIIVHFINNLIAVASLVVTENFSPTIQTVFISMLYVVIIAVGIVCTVSFRKRNQNIYNGFSRGECNCLTTGEKTSQFIISIPMIIAMAFLVYETSMYISSANG